MSNLILSQDGSHTIHSEQFGVSYHSKYGALQETQTVFINAGLKYREAEGLKTIRILEMGFGTGLNALMTMMQANPEIQINYHTIEAYPINEDQYKQLNYPTLLKLDSSSRNAFYEMHSCPSGTTIPLNDRFLFTKHLKKLEEFETSEMFDIIYYDAFAPTSQEELWTEDIMSKLYGMCNSKAVLVTYCAKGSFKRALKAAGFQVEGIDGPIGKREMTRAHKPKLIN